MSSRRSRQFDRWFAGLPVVDGFPAVSDPRRFGNVEDGEAAYAEQFVVDAGYEAAVGAGIEAALSVVDADRRGPALEIGAGTGIFSRSLIAATDYPSYVITDMSAEFLRLTRDSVDKAGIDKPVDYVVLSADELQRWPESTLSLVALRFVLHHVLDWRGFIQRAAGRLRPGGVLLLEEPCADGYLLQAMLVALARDGLACQKKLPEQVGADLDFFVDTTFWYLRTGVDKAASEDKHVFPVAHLLDACRDAGLIPTVFPNHGLEYELAPPEPDYFARELRHNLAGNFGFGPETLTFYDEVIAPTAARVGALDGSDTGPVVRCVTVARRPHLGEKLHGPEARARLVAGARRAERAARSMPGARRAAKVARAVPGARRLEDKARSLAP